MYFPYEYYSWVKLCFSGEVTRLFVGMDTIHNICPKPEEVLLESVRENNIPKIRELVASNSELLGYVYGWPFKGKTIIHIICSTLSWEINADTVETLIDLGVNLYEASSELDEMQALHYASLSVNPRILEIICKSLEEGEINSITRWEETALLIIIKRCDCESKNALECIKVLLAHKADVNKADLFGSSPILEASRNGYRKVVELLLDNPDTDIDTHIYDGKTARELIIQNKLYNNKNLPSKKNILISLRSWMPHFLKKCSIEDVQDPTDIDYQGETDALIEMEEMKPEEQLLDYVRCNNIPKIKELVASNPGILEYVYGLPFKGKTIIHIVCSSLSWEVDADTAETLMDLGVNLYKCCEDNEEKEAIHFAALSLNPELLEVICKNLEPTKIDSTTTDGETALLLIIKDCDCESRNALECIKVLLAHKADINKADEDNLSPIWYAAWKRYRKVVEFLLGNTDTDIDTHKNQGKTARDYIIIYNLCNKKKIEEWPISSKCLLLKELFQTLRERREDDFLEFKIPSDLLNKRDNGETMLQICAKLNLPECTRRLIQLGVDIEARKIFNFPLKIAAKNGHYEVFQEMCVNLEEIPDFLLFLDLDYQNQFNKCLELLLKMNKSLVNKKTFFGQTPLNIASRNANNDAIMLLLENGASIGDPDVDDDRLPIDDIEIETLRKHFDNCTTSYPDKIDDEDLLVTFDYKTLLPSDIEDRILDTEDKESDSTDTDTEIDTDYQFSGGDNAETYSEIDVISHMTKNKKLHPLLIHPLITSFIRIKWERIKYFLYANLLLYVIAWLSFITYALIFYNDRDYQRGSNGFEKSLLVIIWLTFSSFIVKEMFQLVVSPLLYIKKIDNLLEIAFIILIGSILCCPGHDENIKKQISAVAILVSSFQLVLLIGHLPKMSTYIEMLKTVSYSFFKLLLWNAIPILAFSLSFYTLFGDTTRSYNEMLNNSTDSKEENNAFDGIGVSLFKTFVMMTGEFDASDIDFSNVPISWFIFVLFIFMIFIVLSNLMNGLAVSDTQEIRSNAEFLAYISRIDHIFYIENMLLGNLTIIPSKSFKLCKLPSLKFKISLPRKLSGLACLFPNYLKCFKMKVYLNQKGKIKLRHSKKVVRLDEKTLRNARMLLMDRKKLDKVDYSIQKRLETVDGSTQKIETKVDSVRKKLQDVYDSLWKKIEAVDDSMHKKLQDVNDSLRKKFETVDESTLKHETIVDSVQKKMEAADDSMQKKLQGVDDSIQKKLEIVEELLQKKFEDVDDLMQQKLETVNNSLQKRLESVEEQQKLMLDNMNAISQNINKILEKIK